MLRTRTRVPRRTRALLAAAVPAVALAVSLPSAVLPTAGRAAAEDATTALLREDPPLVLAAAVSEIEPVPARRPRPDRDPSRRAGKAAFARIGDVELVPPVAAPRLVGFHESNGPGPLTLRPVDDVRPMATLPSRGRGTAPRSAVDIAVDVGDDVRAVVTGTVTAVNAYGLYGGVTDHIVAIAPAEAPGLQVRMLHIEDVTVRVGQRVVGGETVVAGSARLLPFGSQIDRHTGRRTPHVHVEVHRAG